jgi:hypothetical protein
MVNYQNSLVYKLECKDLEITDIYIGSTCNFNRRKQMHKSVCTNENCKDYNTPVYQYIRQNGGWFNWQMILIEEVPCQNKKQLNRIEAKYIKELGAVLNCYIPCRTKEEIVEYYKKYNKEYRQKNKEELDEYHKKYNKEYMQKNKEELYEKRKQKIECNCGSVVTKASLSRHKKSIKHQQWEQEQN